MNKLYQVRLCFNLESKNDWELFDEEVYPSLFNTYYKLIDDKYIIRDSIERKMFFHADLEPNSNSIKLQINKNCQIGETTLLNLLINTDTDIGIVIKCSTDGGLTYSPYFVGFLTDNYTITFTHSGIEVIELKGEDFTNKLVKRKMYYNRSYRNKKVSFIVGDLDVWPETRIFCEWKPTNPTITNNIVATNFLEGEENIYDYIKPLLYEFGYTFYYNERGYLVWKTFNTTYTIEPSIGFFNTSTKRNIVGKIKVEKNRVKYSRVQINWQTIKQMQNQIVFSDTTGGDSSQKANIVLAAGAYYPEGSSAEDDVYSEYKLATGEKIISVDTVSADITKDSSITTVSLQNFYTRAKLKLRNDGGVEHNISKLDLIGGTVYAEDIFNKTLAKSAGAGADKQKWLEYEAKYIHSLAEAEYLANKIYDYYQKANLTYTIKSSDVFQIGDVVKIQEDAVSGISTVAQIMSKTDTAASDVIEYKLFGISSATVAPVLSTSWLNDKATINNPTSDVVKTSTLENATLATERKAIFLSCPSLLIPLSVYPTSGATTSEYANLILLGRKYTGTINVYVVLPPPKSYDAKWAEVITQLREAGISVLFECDTLSETKAVATVKEDIDIILNNYSNIDGLYFDNVSVVSPLSVSLASYYRDIKTYAKNSGLFPIVFGVDAKVDSDYYTASVADLFVIHNEMEYPSVSELQTYEAETGERKTERAILIGKPFVSTKFRELLGYANVLYVSDEPNRCLSSQTSEMDCSLSVVNVRKWYDTNMQKYWEGAKTVANYPEQIVPTAYTFWIPKEDGIYSSRAQSTAMQMGTIYCWADIMFASTSMSADLSVEQVSSRAKSFLPTSLEEQLQVITGAYNWSQIITTVPPTTPLITTAEWVATGQLSWNFQNDLGNSLTCYEVMISTDKDVENSDPDNGTWWMPRNDGVEWYQAGDTEHDPLQITTDTYTFTAPMNLDTEGNSIATIFYFKIRRVAGDVRSDWGYQQLTLRPILKVAIGTDSIEAPMIRAGAITADKIAVGSITAAKILSVDGGAIQTGNIQSTGYTPGQAGWKLALGGSGEFNDVVVRGTVYATDGTFSGSINSGPLMLNKSAPSTTSSTITSGSSFVTWLRAVITSTGLTGGSFNCSGSYNGTALGRIEIQVSSTANPLTYWQKTGSTTTKTTVQVPYSYLVGIPYIDAFGNTTIIYQTLTGFRNVDYELTTEHDALWESNQTTTNYTVKFYSATNALLATYTDFYKTARNWTQTGTVADNKSAPTAFPSDEAVSQGTVVFTASGTCSFTAGGYTYRLTNIPSGYDVSYPLGTVYSDSGGFLKIKT